MWTNKEGYAVEDGLEGLTEKESKLASYWNTPFKKICLGMTVNNETKWMMFDYNASSLYSVIADGQYRGTSAGRVTWLSLIAGSSLQDYCNYEGFNINLTSVGAPSYMYLRVGFVGNNENDCETPDSWIGFGAEHVTFFGNEHNLACGNRAFLPVPPNVDLPAFGYILVQ